MTILYYLLLGRQANPRQKGYLVMENATELHTQCTAMESVGKFKLIAILLPEKHVELVVS